MHATDLSEEFWADSYCGRPIAVLNRGGNWLVYLDHALQPRMTFATAEAGFTWLRRKVDQAKPQRRH
jgi:hypothetical protein